HSTNCYSFVLSTLAIQFFSAFFADADPTDIYTLSLHDALPIWHDRALSRVLDLSAEEGRHVPRARGGRRRRPDPLPDRAAEDQRSEEHTSELQSLRHLVCRLPLEKKNSSELYTPNASVGANTIN